MYRNEHRACGSHQHLRDSGAVRSPSVRAAQGLSGARLGPGALLAALALALAATALLPELWFPLARDQGVFACVAGRILRGALPYRDAWDIKPPPIYLTYAA